MCPCLTFAVHVEQWCCAVRQCTLSEFAAMPMLYVHFYAILVLPSVMLVMLYVVHSSTLDAAVRFIGSIAVHFVARVHFTSSLATTLHVPFFIAASTLARSTIFAVIVEIVLIECATLPLVR